MSKIYADTIETENSNVDITLGASGDAVLIPTGATLKTNKIADAGGNNIITSDGSGNLTINSGLGSKEVLLTSQTASGSASISFITKIDSTYDVYIFRMNSINPVTDGTELTVNFSSDAGSNYNVVKTTTSYGAYHDSSSVWLAYVAEWDLAQSANAQDIIKDIGNGADESGAGELFLFTPSSTTYVKHFMSTGQCYHKDDASLELFIAGYLNTTSAVNAVQFKMASGNFDGYISMYGIKST